MMESCAASATRGGLRVGSETSMDAEYGLLMASSRKVRLEFVVHPNQKDQQVRRHPTTAPAIRMRGPTASRHYFFGR